MMTMAAWLAKSFTREMYIAVREKPRPLLKMAKVPMGTPMTGLPTDIGWIYALDGMEGVAVNNVGPSPGNNLASQTFSQRGGLVAADALVHSLAV
ncbi:hypothetical protein ACX80H_12300 [Arthrobacter sp. MDT2-2]